MNSENTWRRIGIILVLTGLVFLPFQNCSQSGFNFTKEEPSKESSPGPTPTPAPVVPPTPIPGGTVVVPPGTCQKGKRLAVWLDRNQDSNLTNNEYMGSVVAYKGSKTGAANYNYYSASAHPFVGPNPVPYKSHVFFYEGSDGLSLTLFSNIDEGGSPDNIVNWDLETSGNGGTDQLLLSDDEGELTSTGANGSVNTYAGRFHYWSNTDGGVIGPFNGTGFKIRVHVLAVGDVQNVSFYSSDGGVFTLMDSNSDFVYYVTYQDYEDCAP